MHAVQKIYSITFTCVHRLTVLSLIALNRSSTTIQNNRCDISESWGMPGYYLVARLKFFVVSPVIYYICWSVILKFLWSVDILQHARFLHVILLSYSIMLILALLWALVTRRIGVPRGWGDVCQVAGKPLTRYFLRVVRGVISRAA